MSAQTAIAAVYALLKTVPGVGPNVYDQIRFSNDDATFNALFVDAVTNPAAPIVRTWMVSRESTPSKDEAMQAYRDTHNIVMTGFMSFQDGISEPIWQAQIDAIRAIFGAFANRHLGGLFDWSGPPQAEAVRVVFFRNVLCHSVRIIHPVQEFPLN
jgi:hypothetical protein